MSSTFERVVDIAVEAGLANRAKCKHNTAVNQDLSISGDEGDTFVKALCGEFGEWVANWPWSEFVDFNEPPSRLGPKIWKLVRLPNPERAFPGYTERRLELGHIAEVIEKGEWFDP